MASFTERYHELTKYNPDTIDKLGPPPAHWSRQPEPFKDPDEAEGRIALAPFLQNPAPPADADPGDPAVLAWLLHHTAGITAEIPLAGGERFRMRAMPSAGGLYPTEIYVAVRDGGGVPGGLYHYHPLHSALFPVRPGEDWLGLAYAFLDQPAADSARAVALFTGLYARGAWRYKERAYRRILLDTGHALGNMLVTAGALGLGARPLGAFIDDAVEDLLFLVPKEEFPLLGVALGPRTWAPADQGGQRPGPPPQVAVTRAEADDPMQVQQNACERILPRDAPRPPVDPASTWPPPSGGLRSPFATIRRRRSCRRFGPDPLPRADMLRILDYAYPASGDLLAPGYLDGHVVVLNVEDCPPGIYRHRPRGDLERLRSGDFRDECLFMSLGQELASDCAFLLVHTADLARLTSAFGDRGYRYACLDAGQIGERINLAAVELGRGASGIGGYFDDRANQTLGLPLAQAVIYITVVGTEAGGEG